MVKEIEKYTPKENWLVGLLFEEGLFPFRIIRKENTHYSEYALNGDNTDNVGKLAVNTANGTWSTPTDAEGRYILEPQEEAHIYQVFTGIAPSTGEVYLSFPQRVDRGSIIAERTVPGAIGKWTGHDSPYNDPSPMTELWTVDDKYPYFQVANAGIADEAQEVWINFFINIYSYKVIEDRRVTEEMIRGKRRATIYTMGDPEQPISIPSWISRRYKQYMVEPEGVNI